MNAIIEMGMCIAKFDADLLSGDSFDIDFHGSMMVRFEKSEDGKWIAVNAMDGFGNNCRDKVEGKEGIVYQSLPNREEGRELQEKWNTGRPEFGIEVIGFNESWIDEDFNPTGTCVCFLQDGEPAYWLISKWCNYHDEWHTRYSHEALPNLGENFGGHEYIDAPTHWQLKPTINLPI